MSPFSLRETRAGAEVYVWRAYPSWAHFTWLYFFSLMAALRALLFLRFGVEGWRTWCLGALLLLGSAAAVRQWAEYALTATRVLLRSGYTGREIQSLALNNVGEVTISQGPLARFFGIGTIVIRSQGGETSVSLRGVKDPEVVKSRLDALRPPAGCV
jgi:membrane protein YdbS with pleckstrin-like domain